MRLLNSAAALGAGLLLAGCATTAPPPGALTQYVGSGCATSPDLASAVSLTPPKNKEKAIFAATAPVPATGACLDRKGKPSPYVVFALPSDYGDKTIAVGGLLEATRIFAPDVVILDQAGNVSRSFEAEDYHYRGAVYSVQFTPRAEERHVLVYADHALVGRQYDSVAIGTNSTVICTGYGCGSYTTGVDTSHSRTFSYEGVVQATVYDSYVQKGR